MISRTRLLILTGVIAFLTLSHRVIHPWILGAGSAQGSALFWKHSLLEFAFDLALITGFLFLHRHLLRKSLEDLARALDSRSPDSLAPWEKATGPFGRVVREVIRRLERERDLQRQIEAREAEYEDFLGKNRDLGREVDRRTAELQETISRLKSEISQRKRIEERFLHLAYHDTLTGLPNRTLFTDRVQQALALGRQEGASTGILHVDIDRFHATNESLGHHRGDEVLRKAAEKISRCVRSGDTVARFAGDEFVVVMPQIRDREEIIETYRLVQGALASLKSHEGRGLHLTCTGGATLAPGDGEDLGSLLRNAEMAVHFAKVNAKGELRFFDAGMREASERVLSIEVDLRMALEREELHLFYQPQIDLRSGRIAGIEALIRWRHPLLQWVTPDQFIPVAEQSGLIDPIGAWVLGEACRRNFQWQRRGIGPFPVSVNLSAIQLRRPETFLDALDRALGESRLDPAWLRLEITETDILEGGDETLHTFESIRERGVELSLDDFGTGYSSFAYLRDYPIHELKLDRSFIRPLPESAEDAAIVGAMIRMARHLRMRVVAEGVETAEQAAFLKDQVCDIAQGYLFSKPLSAEEFETYAEGIAKGA